MTNKQLCCFLKDIYDKLKNEKASINGRGLFGGAWERHDERDMIFIIVTSHELDCNSFMGCHV